MRVQYIRGLYIEHKLRKHRKWLWILEEGDGCLTSNLTSSRNRENRSAGSTVTTRDGLGLPRPKMVIKYDADDCVGCYACEYFCSTYHEGATSSSLSRITVHRYPPSVLVAVETCRQCLSASCMQACYVPGAMYVDEKTGARCIDETKCTGCRQCLEACPFNEEGAIIKFNAEKRVCVKCDLCSGRAEGPACVEACKWGALTLRQSRKARR